MAAVWYLIYIITIGGHTLTSEKIQMDSSGACVSALRQLSKENNDESFCISSQGTIMK